MNEHANALEKNGFVTINSIYSEAELEEISKTINCVDSTGASFRKSAGLFAIRRFLKEVPQTVPLIFNEKLTTLINDLFGSDFFVVKAIYFDKPEQSNWFVAYHQDLTISVDKKIEMTGYGPWTIKQNQFAVQPPLALLKSIYTIRIHLDHTDANNGALKVIPGSHKDIYRPETIDWTKETEYNCSVAKGGIMVMRPLLLHSSGRTTNAEKRRVIHIELCNQMLPEGLGWAEYTETTSNFDS